VPNVEGFTIDTLPPTITFRKRSSSVIVMSGQADVAILDPGAISAALAGRLSSLHETQSPWEAVEHVAITEVAPLVERYGASAVLDALETAKHDPLIAALLVDGAGLGNFRLPRCPAYRGCERLRCYPALL
jgi:hypothetical protein